MKISRTTWMHVFLAVGLALAALLFIKLHNASGATLSSDSGSAGHRLADAWCKDCHAIEATAAGNADAAPAFIAIANQPSTTELSLKCFFGPATAACPTS